MSDELLTVVEGRLWFDGVDVVRLAGRVPTPFFLYSRRRLRGTLAAFSAAFSSRHPRARLFYASKACSNRWVLGEIRGAGIEVEVNSGGELRAALREGFAAGQVVFNGVAKTEAEIAEAARAGVCAVVADSLVELERIAIAARQARAHVRVAVRVDVRVPTLTHPGLETAHGGKAGIDRDDVAAAFTAAREAEWIDPVAVHLHIGSQITSVEPYRQALAVALDVVEEAEATLGAPLQALDAGGGFAVPYEAAPAGCRPADYFCSRLSPDDYAAAVCDLPRERRPDLELWLEPGRSLVASAAVLVTRVENEKVKGRRGPDGERTGDERWITVDAGFNTLLEHTNYRWYYRLLNASRAGAPADAPFRVGGPLCDGGDEFAGDGGTPYRELPAATGVGDVLTFLDTGAYTLEMMNPYNLRPRAAAYAVLGDGDVALVRRRETDADMTACDVLP